jgi:hypothetical protein
MNCRLAPISLAGQRQKSNEGFWTFDNIPFRVLRELYNFCPSEDWVGRLRASCVRLSGGGSGAFVSAKGLVLTNHHLIYPQLIKHKINNQHDYVENGFYAASKDQEMKLQNLDIEVLLSSENISSRVLSDSAEETDDLRTRERRKAIITKILAEIRGVSHLQPELVELFGGAEYWLYLYKRFTDVRLVFAPEQRVAFFGGQYDNFVYPRYSLDFALLRVYENGRPLDTSNFLRLNANPAPEGELVFVPGNPISSSRSKTLAQLYRERDFRLPLVISRLRRDVDAVEEYAARGPEQARQVAERGVNLRESLRVYEGRYLALQDPHVFVKKQHEEDKLKNHVRSHPEWQRRFGDTWQLIEAAESNAAEAFKARLFRRIDSRLFELALSIVRYAAEIRKPDEKRLQGFHDSELASFRRNVIACGPVFPEMDEFFLREGFIQMRRELGATDEVLVSILDENDEKLAASALVKGTRLEKENYREELLDGGEALVRASKDSMIVLARKLDPMLRDESMYSDDDVERVRQICAERLNRIKFLIYGNSVYPDATRTLRLSFGTVQGYETNGGRMPHETTFFGLYDRAHSFGLSGMYELPSRFLSCLESKQLSTPLNFVIACDVVGGSSGSPVVDEKGKIVGVVFDCNTEALAGEYSYQEESGRAIAVQSAAIFMVLGRIYGANALVKELLSAHSD